ncbi:MAG: metal-dependent transcriptional regulator [Ruminococcus sp.]|jgi:Mn-dependent DtxR family transcriptional regulator|nr:metal-dependent transcriptional regulator [Ruminococcus sp.]MBQ7009512.1 metal-dependent transcriptional regulator [Ruminococcus sp.]MBR4022633.1 metal-dependent transcriptional regulator [Ruminococcus sp.]
MSIHESGENYLETILLLSKKKSEVRSIDIVNELNLSRPSVSRAMSILKNDGLITIDSGGFITLSAEGLAIAERIYERHHIITDVLIRLGVPEEIAAQDACKIEHDLSDESFECIKKHIAQYGK